jgi:hypothetical protein
MKSVLLRELAHARSGDKGSSANIGVIAYTPDGYLFLQKYLTTERVQEYFKPLGVTSAKRFELPNLKALNFLLHNALAEGGSRSLRIDSQGKALGQAILQMSIEIPEEILKKSIVNDK